jgi:O-antigen/teichoic acid export membrane protein
VKGKSKLIFLNLALGVILNIILDFLLIPLPNILFLDNSLGINGAAIATMTSTIFLSFLCMFQAKYYFSIIPIKKQMIKFVFISIIPIILILYLKEIIVINIVSFFLLSLFYLLFYLLSILLFNGLDENDWRIIKSAKNKFLKR